MADSRPIPTNLLSWPGICKLLPEQKLIIYYLWANRFTKTCGCYEFPIQMASVELSISDVALEEAINDFCRLGFIEVDNATGEVYVLAWLRFHKFKNVVQQVMYWTSVGQIQSERLAQLVIERAKIKNIPFPGIYPGNNASNIESMGYNLTRTATGTATGTATATATKPNSRARKSAIPKECLQRLRELGYFADKKVPEERSLQTRSAEGLRPPLRPFVPDPLGKPTVSPAYGGSPFPSA